MNDSTSLAVLSQHEKHEPIYEIFNIQILYITSYQLKYILIKIV